VSDLVVRVPDCAHLVHRPVVARCAVVDRNWCNRQTVPRQGGAPAPASNRPYRAGILRVQHPSRIPGKVSHRTAVASGKGVQFCASIDQSERAGSGLSVAVPILVTSLERRRRGAGGGCHADGGA
jgi:hypothetical protein